MCRSSRSSIYFSNHIDFAVKSLIMVVPIRHNELFVNTFRQQINAYRLTLSFSLVLVLVCFFGSQVAGRADQQSLSIASQLWYSVAAHQTCLGKRISDNNAFDHDLDDLPSIITGNNHSLPHVKASGNEYPLAQHLAPAQRSYQHPLLRAPPSA